MSFAPVNYCAFMDLVPIYEWVTCDPDEAATDGLPPSATVPSTSGADVPPSDAPRSEDLPEDRAESAEDQRRRLVFVGFQWRPAFSVATFPSPAWIEGIAASCTDEADSSRQREDAQRRASEASRACRQALEQQPGSSPSPAIDNTASTRPSPAEDE